MCVFSPLCKCLLKLPASRDANWHWLHLFVFSPIWVFKCLLKALWSQQSRRLSRHNGIVCIDLTFLHCVLSNVISNFLNEQRKTLLCVFQVVPQVACSKGCIITLVASIDFSPLCDFKCVLKLAGQVDAKLHWLHLFDLSPLCLFKSHWMHCNALV